MRPVHALVALAVAGPLAVGVVLTATSDPEVRSTVAITFADPDIVESSGLVVRDGRFVTVNDSGDTGRVFTVDDRGRTIGTTGWGEAVDVEALAPWRDGQVLVGDLGDNLERRESVEVLAVPVGPGDRQVEPDRLELTYPDGPLDAETLLVHPRTGRVVVVTKGVFGGEVVMAPPRLRGDGPNRMSRVGTVLGIATDGAFLPDGRHLVVRDYTRAVVYAWPSLAEVGSFDLPEQPQGEGLAVDEEGRLFVSTEGARSEVLRVELPADVARAVAPPRPDPEPTTEPSTEPSTEPTTEPPPSGGPAADGDGTPDGVAAERPLWPWAAGGLVGVAALVLLVRSLRPR